MKKNKLGWLLAVPALFGFGMTSCQSNDIADEYIETEGELVEVSLTAVLPEVDTRATLEPNGEKRKFSWESIDLIHVVNADNGAYLGKLGVQNISQSGTSCDFSGQITIPKNATDLHFNFYYLGTEGTIEKNGSSLADMAVSFTEQDGSIASMIKHDILTGKGAYASSAAARKSLGTIKFNRYFAAGYFILKYEDTALDINNIDVMITPEAGSMYTDATLNFQNQTFAKSAGENPSIKVCVTSDEEKRVNNAFFVNFVPTESMQMKFTCTTKEGQSFVGTTKSAWKIGNADYFTKNTAGDPIEIVMKHADGRDDELSLGVAYWSNDGTGMNGYGSDDYTWNNGKLPLTFNINNAAKREGYKFVSWNTQPDGTGDTYYPFNWENVPEGGKTSFIYTKEDYVRDGMAQKETKIVKNLYAQWEKATFDYKISFELGDGVSGTKPADKTGTVNVGETVNVDLPGTGDEGFDLKKEGFDFVGWTVKDGDGTKVSDPYEVGENNKEVILVPKWEAKPSGGIVTAPGSYGDEL